MPFSCSGLSGISCLFGMGDALAGLCHFVLEHDTSSYLVAEDGSTLVTE